MSTTSHALFTIALFGATAMGCSNDEGDVFVDSTTRGLEITSHDSHQLAGTFGHEDGAIRFKAFAGSNGDAQLEFVIGDKAFAYQGSPLAEGRRGWFRVTADHEISASDISASRALLDAMTTYLGTDTAAVSLYESSVPKMAYWITQQPAGLVASSLLRYEYFEHEARPYTLNNDGVTCIKRNTAVTAYYDDRNNVATSQSVTVGADWGTSACGSGNYSCMGRCGAGCSGFGGGWTLDCLEHDVCSHNLCASGGGSSPDCGDEYNHASGDIFSSCSGN